ncbi:MAG: obg [Rickettsiaceae bacterium]|jgi:GTP-binding protein|nr:obg [Rickettsiaceae bacterium]
MKFLDEAKIYVKSGNGGAGCVSFRREKYVAMGGPDGGNGGTGGSIIFEANDHLNTLVNFRYKQHFKARVGEHGKGQNRNGKSAEDLILQVPVGTQIFSEEHEHLIHDFLEHGERFTLLKGGRGGLGNSNFKSSRNQAPRQTTPAELGAEMWVWLKLKLISDAGLVGLPNAGKSTFLSRVSAAKPKIADYPFTTLTPNLGVVSVDEEEFVMADIPGLIEGAHLGHGLGDKFLKHIERCGVLLHLIDGTEENIVKSYKTIRRELEEYSPFLKDKQEIVCLNKIDALQEEDLKEKLKALKKVYKGQVYVISGVTGQGISEVLRIVLKQIKLFKGLIEEE